MAPRHQHHSWAGTPKGDGPAIAAATPIQLTGPRTPQVGVPMPDLADRLPLREVSGEAPLWLTGAHGGAGESTLAKLREGWRASGHAWPQHPGGGNADVVLVARTSSSGLRAAQRASTQWAAGLVPGVTLHGLVLVADAPGRLPKPLQQLAQLVGGGVPRTWVLPWVENWRLGEPVALETAPLQAKRLIENLEEFTSGRPARNDQKAEQ